MFRGGIGAPEILLILGVVILLFGAKKLPDLARGSGRALRIFKSETKGLIDDEDKDSSEETSAGRELPSTTGDREATGSSREATNQRSEEPR